MAKLVLADVLGGHSQIKINDNFQRIEDALNSQVLYRDNPVGEDNTLHNTMDMNGQALINLRAPSGDNHAARLKDVRNAIYGEAGHTANLIDFEPTPELVSTNVQGAVEEAYGKAHAEVLSALEYTPSFLGGVSRSIASKLEERITPRDVGGVPDWNGTTGTDNTAALQMAIDAAILKKLPLYIDGSYYVAGNITANGKLTLVGGGASISNIVFGTNVNLVYTGGTQNEYAGNQLSIYGVGFRTTNLNTKPVVDIVWTGGVGGTSSTIVIEDCEVTGVNGTSGFLSAFRFNNARNVSVRNVRILGDRSSASVYSGYGFDILGDSSPVEFAFSQCRVYFVVFAMNISGSTVEGVYISQCAFIGVKTGVNWLTTASKPLLSIVNSHINATSVCVNTVNVVQVVLNGNLFYIQNFANLAATGASAVQVKNDVPGTDLASLVVNNIFYFLSGPVAKNGLVVLSGSGTETAVVDNNIFASFDSGVVLATSTGSVRVGEGNKFIACTSSVTNNGEGNTVVYKVPHQSSTVVTMASGPLFSDHTITIPTGLFTAKPDSVVVTPADNSVVSLNLAYMYSDANTTANSIVVRIRRADGAAMSGGSLRISYIVA